MGGKGGKDGEGGEGRGEGRGATKAMGAGGAQQISRKRGEAVGEGGKSRYQGWEMNAKNGFVQTFRLKVWACGLGGFS